MLQDFPHYLVMPENSNCANFSGMWDVRINIIRYVAVL